MIYSFDKIMCYLCLCFVELKLLRISVRRWACGSSWVTHSKSVLVTEFPIMATDLMLELCEYFRIVLLI